MEAFPQTFCRAILVLLIVAHGVAQVPLRADSLELIQPAQTCGISRCSGDARRAFWHSGRQF
jgi:hypothetical protein